MVTVHCASPPWTLMMVEKAEMTPWVLPRRPFSGSKFMRLAVSRENFSFVVMSLRLFTLMEHLTQGFRTARHLGALQELPRSQQLLQPGLVYSLQMQQSTGQMHSGLRCCVDLNRGPYKLAKGPDQRHSSEPVGQSRCCWDGHLFWGGCHNKYF